MSFQTFLSAASTWLTYLIQIACAYCIILGLCRFIGSPRIRLRLWVGFLTFTLLDWLLYLWRGIDLGPITEILGSSVVPTQTMLQWSLRVQEPWAHHLPTLASGLRWIYGVVVGVLLSQLLVKWWQLRRLLDAAQPPPQELASIFKRLCRKVRAPFCELKVLPELRSPAAACWWRPRVLLPAELVPQVAGKQLINILLHELIHVRRRDYLWEQLAAVACRLVFFHPAMWLAYRRLRWERELVCDQSVVEHCGEPRLEYADSLAKLARWRFLRARSAVGIDFASSPSLLATRIRALLRKPSSHPRLRLAGNSAIILLAAGLGIWLVPGIGITLYGHAERSASALQARQPKQTSRRRNIATSHEATKVLIQHERKVEQTSTPTLSRGEAQGFLPRTKPSIPSRDQSARLDSAENLTGSSKDAGGENVSSSPAWRESPLPGQPAVPTWQQTAVGAIVTGLAVSRGGSDGEQSGTTEQANFASSVQKPK